VRLGSPRWGKVGLTAQHRGTIVIWSLVRMALWSLAGKRSDFVVADRIACRVLIDVWVRIVCARALWRLSAQNGLRHLISERDYCDGHPGRGGDAPGEVHGGDLKLLFDLVCHGN